MAVGDAYAALRIATTLFEVAREVAAATDTSAFSVINATDDAFYAEDPEWIQELKDGWMRSIEVALETAVRLDP